MPRAQNDPINGKRLRRERESRGLSVIALAAKASRDRDRITPEALRSWELGYYAPPPSKLGNLADELGLHPDDLLLPANAPKRLRQKGPPARRRARA